MDAIPECHTRTLAEISEHYFQESVLSSHMEILGLELRLLGSRASVAILPAYICF